MLLLVVFASILGGVLSCSGVVVVVRDVVVGSGGANSSVVVDVGVLGAGSGAVVYLTGTTVDCADSILAVVRSSVVGAVDKREGEQTGTGYREKSRLQLLG